MILKHHDHYHKLTYGTLCFFAQMVQIFTLKLMQMEIVRLVLK